MSEKQRKKQGRPSVDTEAVLVRMSRELLEAIDEHRHADLGVPSRPELIRRIVAEWFAAKSKDGSDQGADN
ncbi:MAG: ribbon-helix-helix protein, CopG family [Pseudotabrizicola sp.]|uniref:ribbon-helix-helix protein, CopG family n=1 Tax=Pseudotabrizicola sp. TaxID=2939647 RepID=UPI00272F8AFC|nr:ribbon-helix-helix protein, CopG family [Pseudotabrizicola sp.]MDP2079594.1 ribbon-helix-helix protein, CopG family [Pseudotabrizicola sp.]MDZ7576363.1 ribbon-helix-helix protein, CopG family [Pseudotabrizicola sp.]